MAAEIFSIAFLPLVLIPIGIVSGYLLLKLQGAEE
ncbi:MAG TPA: cytochrome b6-f complex subunit PetM [Halomicronema sp.]